MALRNSFPTNVRIQSQFISGELLKFCLESKVDQRNAFSIFETLQKYTNDLLDLQRKFCFVRYLESGSTKRLELVQSFLKDCETCLQRDVSAKEFPEAGIGLSADSSIEYGSCVLRIPRGMFLDNNTPFTEAFDNFVVNDPIASSMPNVTLALRLLAELSQLDQSKHFRYIKSLPLRIPTFLSFNSDILEGLRGSKALESVVSNFQFICRQYAYFYSKIRMASLPFSSCFCFEDYRWAVSVVMSRNNLVPDQTGTNKIMCLIPIWDLINFKAGQLSTDFDLETDELIFYAMESVTPGEQIFMDYGKRTNTELLLYLGFVPIENPHNQVSIHLGLSAADKLASKRSTLLGRVCLETPLVRNLCRKLTVLVDLVSFARIFVMTEAELDSFLASKDLSTIRSPILSRPRDEKAVDFLVKRFHLLIMAYGTLVSEEEMNNRQCDSLRRYCERLRRQEVEILDLAIKALSRFSYLPTNE